MKKILLLLLMIVSVNTFAQDELIYRDGDTYEVKVIEITDTEVKYRKWNNLNGPIYTESQSELFMLIFENGEKEVFENENKSRNKSKISTNAFGGDFFSSGEYGRRMTSISPLHLIGGGLTTYHEIFNQRKTKRSIRIPLMISLVSVDHDLYDYYYMTGVDHKYYPTKHAGKIKGYIGNSFMVGVIVDEYIYYGSKRKETWEIINEKFIAGVNFHFTPKVALALEGGVGIGIVGEKFYTPFHINLNLGFRY
ncbi:MAG: hypothetical protein H8E84_00890 [Flavobacteriales bacterium]|nr:hypothetical protein [Flavobacteriales bacterium]